MNSEASRRTLGQNGIKSVVRLVDLETLAGSSLLKTDFLVESKDFVGRRESLVSTCDEALNLRPVNSVWLEFFHAVLREERAYWDTRCS